MLAVRADLPAGLVQFVKLLLGQETVPADEFRDDVHGGGKTAFLQFRERVLVNVAAGIVEGDGDHALHALAVHEQQAGESNHGKAAFMRSHAQHQAVDRGPVGSRRRGPRAGGNGQVDPFTLAGCGQHGTQVRVQVLLEVALSRDHHFRHADGAPVVRKHADPQLAAAQVAAVTAGPRAGRVAGTVGGDYECRVHGGDTAGFEPVEPVACLRHGCELQQRGKQGKSYQGRSFRASSSALSSSLLAPRSGRVTPSAQSK